MIQYDVSTISAMSVCTHNKQASSSKKREIKLQTRNNIATALTKETSMVVISKYLNWLIESFLFNIAFILPLYVIGVGVDCGKINKVVYEHWKTETHFYLRKLKKKSFAWSLLL